MVLLRRFTLVVAAVGFAAACKDPVDPAPSPTIVAQWAGHSWKGEASAFFGAGDTLWVFGQSGSEYLRMRAVVRGPGAYVLGPDAATFTQTLGGDAVVAEYVTTSTDTGTLVINVYDKAAGLVEGQFAFDAVTSSSTASYGPRASMKNGYFSASMQFAAQ